MIIEPKFYSNLPDNNHCLQASVMMVLNTLAGSVTWDEVNTLTEYEDSLYSWLPRAVVVLNQRINGVKYIPGLDYREFANRGVEYLREYMSPEWFELQKQHASPNFGKEQLAAKDCVLQNLLLQQQEITMEDVDRWLNDYIMIILVNSRLLAGKEGSAGHFVLVYGKTQWDYFLHNPGLPPQPSLRVLKSQFTQSIQGEVILIPKGHIPFGMEVQPNQACWCDSGKKYKECHGANQ